MSDPVKTAEKIVRVYNEAVVKNEQQEQGNRDDRQPAVGSHQGQQQR